MTLTWIISGIVVTDRGERVVAMVVASKTQRDAMDQADMMALKHYGQVMTHHTSVLASVVYIAKTVELKDA